MTGAGSIVRALALLVSFALPAGAVEPGEALGDPALEQRARALSKEIRCLVCQNQSIDESDADLARDLRHIVRERIEAGDSDDAVRTFLTDRYGDFVLLRPPLKPETYLLWFGPAAILAVGALGAAIHLNRRRKGAPPRPLDASERERVARLIDDGERELPS